ncbi:MAG: flippase-like domain-containing protein [Deltaproteobacteria bacterium]|nr:flippase-like domain-containing protein [Deltaproteobacteria bacterium]
MKKFHTYSVLFGIILLALLIWKIGPKALWRELALLGWGLVPLILIEGVADIFHTLGWRYCLTGPHRSLPFFQLFRIRMAGSSINYITPTATLGGEVTKGALLASNHGGTDAITSVLIGKLAYALAQLLFVAFGTFFILWKIHLPPGIWPAMLVSSSLLAAGIVGFLIVQKAGKFGAVARWFVTHNLGGKALETLAGHLTTVDEELKCFYTQRPGNLPFAIFWHIVGMACGIVQAWYFLLLLTDHGSFFIAAGIWFLGSWFDLLTFPIPLGIGIQEGTRVLALKAVGFDLALGLTYGVVLRLEQIFWAGVGLLLYATLLSAKREGGLFPKKEPVGGKP